MAERRRETSVAVASSLADLGDQQRDEGEADEGGGGEEGDAVLRADPRHRGAESKRAVGGAKGF